MQRPSDEHVVSRTQDVNVRHLAALQLGMPESREAFFAVDELVELFAFGQIEDFALFVRWTYERGDFVVVLPQNKLQGEGRRDEIV